MQVNLNTGYEIKQSQKAYQGGKVAETGNLFDVQIADEYMITSAVQVGEAQENKSAFSEKTATGSVLQMAKEVAQNMSLDEFNAYEELGITPEQDELGKIVTMDDRIKMDLAAHCENYKGDVSDISSDMLQEVYGMAASGMQKQIEEQTQQQTQQQVQETEKQAQENLQLSENGKVFLLKNGMAFTAENVYVAEHAGTVSQKNCLSEEEWSALSSQVAISLERVGMEASEASLEEGRFLIEHGIAATPQNIMSALQMSGGISGDSEMDVEAIVEAVQNGDEAQVENILQAGKEVTVLNLKNPPTLEEVKEKISEERIAKAKRQLQEIQNKMTAQACMSMMRRGFHVEVMTFTEITVEIRKEEQEQAAIFLGEADKTKTDLLQQVLLAMDDMKSVPCAVLGRVAKGEVQFSMQQITYQSVSYGSYSYQSAYAQAETLYQAVGTEVRGDLGDGIAQAFQNSYSVLEEYGMEATSSSKRAVRILGYNEMELSEENLLQVEALDAQVTKLFQNLTPQAAAYMIKKQINPLEMDISELNEKLAELNEEQGFEGSQTFSKYLWKLDQKEALTKEERDAYIGVFKLLRRVEKGDRRAIGAVMKNGQEMSLRNLYQALQNRSYQGSEITVDDTLGVAESVTIADTNLSSQLSNYEKFYDGKLDEIWKKLTPNQVETLGREEILDMNLEELSEQLEKEEEQSYQQARLEEMKEINITSEREVLFLMGEDIPVTMENLLAASYLQSAKGNVFAKLKEENEELERVFEEENQDLEELPEKYEKLIEKAEDTLIDQGNALDMKSYRLFHRSISLMGKMSEKQTYYVPMELGGGTSTVKVSVLENGEEKGKVEVSLTSEKIGKIAVEFRCTTEGIIAYAFGENKESLSVAQAAVVRMEVTYGKIRFDGSMIQELKEHSFGKPAEKEEGVSNRYLYRLAKSFLEGVKNTVE